MLKYIDFKVCLKTAIRGAVVWLTFYLSFITANPYAVLMFRVIGVHVMVGPFNRYYKEKSK